VSVYLPSPSCPANVGNDQKGDDMVRFKDRVIGAIVKILSAIYIPSATGRPALQRIPARRDPIAIARRRR
jgi:hypothetical protein